MSPIFSPNDPSPRRHIRWLPVLIALAIMGYKYFSAETAINPETGRRMRVGLSVEQESALGLQSYREVLSQSHLVDRGPSYDQVVRVARRLAEATGAAGSSFDWQVSVVDSEQVNAFCLPGGKIVVYTGILPVAKTDEGLATVLGHEMAHATLHHGAQRLFKNDLMQTALSGAAMSLGDYSPDQRRTIMGLLGAGAQYGVMLPFSRGDESEADEVGTLYMARAGYDPEESVKFWERMSSVGGDQPPEFMSTHPAHGSRIERLKELMPRAVAEYQKAPAAH